MDEGLNMGTGEQDRKCSCGFQCLLTSWLSFGTGQVLTRDLPKE